MGAVARLAGFWNALAGPSRRLIITAVIVFVVGLGLLFKFSGSAAYSSLVTGVTPQDAAALTAKLRDAGIPYKLADGGTTVKVPADKLDQARLDLAQSNLMGGGGPGYELFDKQSLGATDFTQRVNLLRAREGELARAIGALDPVRSATVKLAMPEQRFFQSDQQPTTASIILEMELGQSLDASQVRGIVNLAANAVPGLTADKVTVADSKGNILSGSGADAEVASVNNRLEAEAAWERSAQSKLDAMLATLVGPGKAVSNVDVTLNMDKVTTQQETFDPAKTTPLDGSTTTETLKSKGGGSGGVTGAAGNTPGAQYPAVTSGTGTTDYNKKTTTSRNGVDHTRSDITKGGGDVEKLSVSVQVDQTANPDIAKIENAVKAALGVDTAVRKDQISVQAVPFAKATGAAGTAAGTSGGTTSTGAPASGGMDIMSLARTAGVAIGVLLMLFMARKSLRRRQGELDSALPELLKRGPVPVAELGPGMVPVAALDGQRKTPVQEQMEALALSKPEDVANLLRGWLAEKSR
jgi:flagellar M-ring protein FliF